MEAVYITGIIVLGVVTVVYLLRDRLSQLFIRASKDQGELNITAREQTPQLQNSQNPYNIDISGNNTFGKTKIGVEREGTKIAGNTAVGQTEINVTLPSQAAANPPQTTNQPTTNPQSQAYLPEASGQPIEAELITETNQEKEQA
jgi:hypothetical protein